jgi:hypothetical protein
MTLESQYEKYLKENPKSKITFDKWMTDVLSVTLLKALKLDEKHTRKD